MASMIFGATPRWGEIVKDLSDLEAKIAGRPNLDIAGGGVHGFHRVWTLKSL